MCASVYRLENFIEGDLVRTGSIAFIESIGTGQGRRFDGSCDPVYEFGVDGCQFCLLLTSFCLN